MPTYIYRCKGCGVPVETGALAPSPDSEGGEFRHLVGDEVCGVFRRDFRAEGAGIAISNLRQEREAR